MMKDDAVKIVRFSAAALGLREQGFPEEILGSHSLWEGLEM